MLSLRDFAANYLYLCILTKKSIVASGSSGKRSHDYVNRSRREIT